MSERPSIVVGEGSRSSERPSIVITGLGAISSVGVGVSALRVAMVEGRDGLTPITRFPTAGFRTCMGGLVPGYEAPLAERASSSDALNAIEDLLVEYGLVAMREAIAEAGLDLRRNVGVVLGTCVGVGFRRFHSVVERLARTLGVRGPCAVATNACAASTLAMGLGRDWLVAGHVDAVIALGADVLLPEIFAGFHAVGVLSATKCAPFSGPVGTTLGEGAGAVVLERAHETHAAIITTLLGYGTSADAWHETAPDPNGAGIARALRGALMDAGLEVGAIDYVNAHGTGTEQNDIAEVRALKTVLGERADVIPISATKSIIGHAQGAAGVLETIATIVAMQAGGVPPTLNATQARPGAPCDPVFGTSLRPHVVRHALSTSAGFGGANTVVAIGAGAGGVMVARPVYIDGVGHVDGADRGALERELLADPRGLDPAALYLTVAARRALAAAGVKVNAANRDRAGLVMAMTRVSPSSLAAYGAAADERGLARISAQAFPRMVLNAPAGTAAKLLSLRGALATLTCGAGSGLLAVATAMHYLAFRDDVDVIVAAGVDEDNDGTDGADALVLRRDGRIRVESVIAGPDDLAALVGRMGRADVTLEASRADACDGVAGCARAIALLRRGEARRVLVTARGPCLSVAVALTMEGHDGND